MIWSQTMILQLCVDVMVLLRICKFMHGLTAMVVMSLVVSSGAAGQTLTSACTLWCCTQTRQHWTRADAESVWHPQKFAPLVEKCKRLNRAMRIGTNHGSLSARILSFYGDTPRGMVESAFEFADMCRDMDYHNFLFSMKASNPLVMVQVHSGNGFTCSIGLHALQEVLQLPCEGV